MSLQPWLCWGGLLSCQQSGTSRLTKGASFLCSQSRYFCCVWIFCGVRRAGKQDGIIVIIKKHLSRTCLVAAGLWRWCPATWTLVCLRLPRNEVSQTLTCAWHVWCIEELGPVLRPLNFSHGETRVDHWARWSVTSPVTELLTEWCTTHAPGRATLSHLHMRIGILTLSNLQRWDHEYAQSESSRTSSHLDFRKPSPRLMELWPSTSEKWLQNTY